MSFFEADNARRATWPGWPHAAHRQMAAETALGVSGLSPSGVIAWFAGAPPQTGRGALALATALRATGQITASAEVDLARPGAPWCSIPIPRTPSSRALAR